MVRQEGKQGSHRPSRSAAVSKGIQGDTEPQYSSRKLTNRSDFARKVKSVFDQLLPGEERNSTKKDNLNLFQKSKSKFISKQYWEEGKITKYIDKMMYGIKNTKDIEKSHRNQLKKKNQAYCKKLWIGTNIIIGGWTHVYKLKRKKEHRVSTNRYQKENIDSNFLNKR